MNKGKLGINLCFYAVLAFIFAIFEMTTPLCLLFGLVLIVEKDEWASRQTLQALLLSVFIGVVRVVESYIGISHIYFANMKDSEILDLINSASSGIGTFFSVVTTLVDLVLLLFAILALANVAKGKEAKVPVFNNIVNWAYGLVAPKPVYVQPAANTQFTGQQNVNYQQPNNAQFTGQQNVNYQQPTNAQFAGQQNVNYQQPDNMQFNGQAPVQNPTEQSAPNNNNN